MTERIPAEPNIPVLTDVIRATASADGRELETLLAEMQTKLASRTLDQRTLAHRIGRLDRRRRRALCSPLPDELRLQHPAQQQAFGMRRARMFHVAAGKPVYPVLVGIAAHVTSSVPNASSYHSARCTRARLRH